MSTLFVTHPACLNHLTPSGHPERPDRLRAIDRALEDERFQSLARVERTQGRALTTSRSAIRANSSTRSRTRRPQEGMVRIDADTAMSPGSFEAALRAIGGARLCGRRGDERQGRQRVLRDAPARPSRRDRAADGLLPVQQRRDRAHATRRRSTAPSAWRIVDFDVHHGNGTQEIFWSDPTVMYCSTHEMPLYPGTGARGERGEHNTIVNAPLRAGDGGEEFRAAFEATILPRLREFKPDLVLISAGFDAHLRDPLANLNLLEADYDWVTRKLMEIADAERGRPRGVAARGRL